MATESMEVLFFHSTLHLSFSNRSKNKKLYIKNLNGGICVLSLLELE